MASTYTSFVQLAKPDPTGGGDAGWGTTTNTNWDYLAALAPIGDLAVKTTEVPSSSLNVRVSAGSFANLAGSAVVDYAGTTSQAIPASVTRKLWLTNAGVLTLGTAYPTTAHVRLATVVTGSTTITSINDDRVTCRAMGT